MRKKAFKKLSSVMVVVLVLGLLPISTVFAEGEDTPTAGPPPAESPAAEPPAADTPEAKPAVKITPEVTLEDMPEPEAEEEEAAAEAEETEETDPAITPEVTLEAMPGEAEETGEPGAAEEAFEEDLDAVIADMAEADVVLADEKGNPLSLAEEETQELLKSGADPFFWNGTEWEGYTSIGGTCPDKVTNCTEVAAPFSSAVAAAPADSTIYVEGGTFSTPVAYNEDVVINKVGLSFVGFQFISLPDAYATGDPLPVPDMYGYAVVDKITLKANFGTTIGVYAKEVVVDGRDDDDGWLDDGFALVNDDGNGTVEADVFLDKVGSDYLIKDEHHRNNANSTYEWECGEPDEIIYPDKSYRVIFKRPQHQDILDYYNGLYPGSAAWNGGDERGLGMTAEERLADLLIGVNLSDQGINPIAPTSFPWNFTNEERVFWYLLGETWAKTNNHTVIQNSNQQNAANTIIDGTFNDIELSSGIWFLWPIQQKNNNGTWTDISLLDLQLTFIHPEDGYCGDGVWDPQREECDPGNGDDIGPSHPGCTEDCTLDWDPSLVLDPYCVREGVEWRMQWVIDNPNSFNITAGWSIPGQGSGTVDLSPGTNLVTTTELGTWSMDVTWNTGSGSLTHTIISCETPDDPPDTPVLTAAAEFLIPVTGAESGFLSGESLAMFGVMAAGVGMIAAGIKRKFRK